MKDPRIFFFTFYVISYLAYQAINGVSATGQTQLDQHTTKKLENEISLLEAEQLVTIASKRSELPTKAPSIVTVITEKEINRMGARTLTEILVIVPGMDVIKEPAFGTVEYGSRGIRRTVEKIKILIDGHSLNSPFDGSAALFFDDFPLKNVKRIEIIRGPGSALYGENAFHGVINIITKSAADIDGLELSSGFGSYDTQEYSILYGKKIYGIDITGFADFYNTNGLSDTIKEDALSVSPLPNRFAITPGDTDDSRDKLDLHLKLSYKDFQLNAKYMNKDTEPFVGPQFILTNDNEQEFNYVMGDLRYELKLWDRLTIKPRVYYDQYDFEFSSEFLPDGFRIPFDLDRDGDVERFPDGMFGSVKGTNRRIGSEIQFDYEIAENNNLTLGFDYKWERQDNIQFNANFDPLTGASIGHLQNSSDLPFKRVYRQIWAIYLQNKWDITDDLSITMGIRHDHYSDFEGTTNPRIGIVWNFLDNATIKFLYGQAFRAPNFVELYTANNPALLGDSNLDEETIRTYEVGLNYKFTEKLSTNVNYFFNVVRDEIVETPKRRPLQPQVFANLAGSNIQGIEFEVKADLADFWEGAYAYANYTYLDSESKGDPQPDIPKHKGNVGFGLNLWKYLDVNIHAFISGDRVREQEDTRDDSPGYALVNCTLIAKEFFKGMKINASLFNLLDKNYNDPSIINTIPTDLPRPGRTFFIGVDYKF